MWLHVPCQFSSKSKTPSGPIDSSSPPLGTPAANPTQNTNDYFSANTEYWGIKELNKLGTLCWTLRTEGNLPRGILFCSLHPLQRNCSKCIPQIRQNISLFFFSWSENQKYFLVVDSREQNFSVILISKNVQHSARNCTSFISSLAHTMMLAAFLKMELLLKKKPFKDSQMKHLSNVKTSPSQQQ